MGTDEAKSEGEEKAVRHSSLEGLKVNFMTAMSAFALIASALITIGIYLAKLSGLEGRLDLAERARVEDKATLSSLKQDNAILEMRVKRAEEVRQADAARLEKISTTVDDIGRMVLIMCQTSPRPPGVTCRLGP